MREGPFAKAGLTLSCASSALNLIKHRIVKGWRLCQNQVETCPLPGRIGSLGSILGKSQAKWVLMRVQILGPARLEDADHFQTRLLGPNLRNLQLSNLLTAPMG